MSQLKLRIVALSLTVALTAALYLFMGWQRDRRRAEEREARSSARLFSFGPKALLELELQNPQGRFTLVPEREGWRLREPRELPADREALRGMAEFLTTLSRLNTIEQAEELGLFGLQPPRYEVTLRTVDEEVTLAVGKKNAFDGNAYARLLGSPEVFLVDGGVHYHLDKTLFDLRDKRVVPLDPKAITAFIGEGRKEGAWRLQAVRTADGFRTVEGEEEDARELQRMAVRELLQRVTRAEIVRLLSESNESDAVAEHAPALSQPDAQWSFETADRSVTVKLRELDDPKRYLVASSALGIAEVVSPVLHRRLIAAPDALFDRRLFPWERSAFDAIALAAGDAAVRLVRGERGWRTAAGAPVEETRINALIYTLSRLTRGSPRSTPAQLRWKEAISVRAEAGEKAKHYELLPAESGLSWAREVGGDPFAFDGSEIGTLSARASHYVDAE